MKEVVKEYFVDLKNGKIFIENIELPKNDQPSHISNLLIMIDKDITDNALIYRLLNVYSFIFNNPNKVSTTIDNEPISKWIQKQSINDNTVNNNVLQSVIKADAILIIWKGNPDDISKLNAFHKEYIFIDYDKIENNEFTLVNKFFIEDTNKDKLSHQGKLQISKNRWLPQPGIIKL